MSNGPSRPTPAPGRRRRRAAVAAVAVAAAAAAVAGYAGSELLVANVDSRTIQAIPGSALPHAGR